ncbi:MAG: hypothetical protein ACI9QD_000696 [Thermoproteota archaeon]|jgi:hypothetical protein
MAQFKDRVTDEAYKNNEYNEVLQKPISVEHFKNVIEHSLSWSNEQAYEECLVEINKEEFLPMKLRNFYLYKSFPFDAYVEVTSVKFLKAIEKDVPYTHSTIQRYAKKYIKNFYIKKDDQIEFLENSMRKCIDQLSILHPGIELAECHIVSFSVLQSFMSQVGVSDLANELIEALIDSIPIQCSYKPLNEIILEFPFINGGTAVKSTITAYMCNYILMSLGWNGRTSFAKLLISSILHDATLENEAWGKIITLEDSKYLELDPEVQEKFTGHIAKAAELSTHFSAYPDISFIIEQHHELPSGKGFPYGWSSIKLTTLSSIFILCQNFSNMLLDLDITKPNLTKLIKYFSTTYNIGNFKQPMKYLAEHFKIRI